MTSTAKERALDAFRRRFRRDPEILVRAPGRVNLIGEHVDYNAGLVLPVAIDRAAWIAAAPSRDGLTTLEAVDVVRDRALHARSASREDGRGESATAVVGTLSGRRRLDPRRS